MKRGVLVLVFLAALARALLRDCSLALTPDGVTLLEVKSSLNDSKNILSNWKDTDESPCQWTGISCSPDDQRVISMYVTLFLLQITKTGFIKQYTERCYTFFSWSFNTSGVSKLVYNFLSGEIPDVGVLSKFGNKSFIGNLDLCGQQVNKPCRTSLGFPAVLPHAESDEATVSNSTVHKRPSHYVKGLVIGAVSMLGFAVILLLGFVWIWFLTKKERAAKRYTKSRNKFIKNRVKLAPLLLSLRFSLIFFLPFVIYFLTFVLGAKLITFHGDLPYPSCELVEKIESLDEEDVVGAGGFGTVYRMVMNDCGTFAVKKIDRTREGSDQVFERELEILGSIKHINLVNLRGYCRLPIAKLLIYDYLAMGSLDDFLHGDVSEDRALNWNARLRIAIGSARGLAYLHHDCSPKIVHRDIKSSNILLDENLEPHVSDFGLAKLLVDEDAHVTTVVAGTFGYLAPEYLQSGRATEKSDVYSFGVLLLELVTGKRPTDPSFVKRGLNVVGWMNTLLRENRLEDVVDKRCTDAEAETVEVLIEIAARCTDANPDDRPSMQQVLQFLEQEVMSPCSVSSTSLIRINLDCLIP
ncbi:UNVERIFIED_CONTAM: LRR receptor-like serine/threonine-protein kinase FEI 1 [Sesamum radiatum]|uniref:LRR receptor-like serine/threonine-protein kinase FEI 1 n=1 Tax=Sesamum radiatum TaxID=300843 RepID=A0AAW2PLY5_SESRA